MASVVEIANAALALLGVDRISAIDENSVAAVACNNCYERLRDKELEAHTWRFAIKRAQLAEHSTAPLFGPSHAFPVPSDFLRTAPPDPEFVTGGGVVIPGTFAQTMAPIDWRIEQHQGALAILTNDSAPLNLRYVAKVTDANLMVATFRDALAALMAHRMCEKLTQSNVKKADARQSYKDAIDEARRINALEKVPEQSADASWIACRA